MAIVRTYECGDCGTRFDKLHFDRSEPPPECPGCQALAAKQVPAGFSVSTSKVGQAADIAYDIMSKDYGFSDMKDNLRQGDIAAPSLPKHLAPAVQNFFTAGGPIIAAAKQGAAQAAAEGRSPLPMMQKVAKKRSGGGPARVICNPVNNVR